MYSLGDLILTFWFGAGFSLVTVGIIFWRRARSPAQTTAGSGGAMARMERRERIVKALEALEKLTGLILDLDLAASSIMADDEKLGFWRENLESELRNLEMDLKLAWDWNLPHVKA